MEISDSEKLIITMLADIMKHNKVKSRLDFESISEAMYGGHHWFLEDLFDKGVDTKEELDAMSSILTMWTSLEEAYKQFDDDQKKDLETKAESFGKNVEFMGFLGNNKTKYMGIVRLLIKEMVSPSHFDIEKIDRFVNQNNETLNSDDYSLQKYLGMFEVFLPILKLLKPEGRNCTVDEMAKILNAKAAH